MSLPAWVWSNGMDFPRLYSWSNKARKELMDFLHYDYGLTLRSLQDLHTPQFENISFASICDDRGASFNLTEYCKLSESIPNLEITMSLMNLAKFPLDFDVSAIESQLGSSFSLSNNSLPKMTAIPTCFFGKEASKYWNTRDYRVTDKDNNILPINYQQTLINQNNLQDPEFYRYPKCHSFSPKPTQSGICHTFNGIELGKILKPSEWMESFSDSFESHDTGELFKSSGIDLHDGFVFTLDLMQAYLINMKERSDDQKDINAFYIKVHPAGEIPWMTSDKSSFKKITAYSNEMSTKFITLKGEKIEGKVYLF